ncbi:MAG: hypothetical protein ACREMN_04085 [Gemmatimonadales bacterium]
MNTRSASGNPRAWGSLALGLAAALWGGACVNDATPPPPPPPPPPQPLPTFTIGLSPAAVAFDDTAGTAAGPAYTVAVTNTGTGTVTGLAVGPIAYSAGAADWLTATLSGTQAPATLTLGAATDSLAPGSYTATVPVASTVATNSPQQLSVTLTLAAPPPPPPPPPPPSVSGTVIVAAGNLGRCTGDLQRAAAAVVAAAQPDYVFVLGDNVEPDSGTRIATLENFQTCYDPLWGQFRSITYAAVGNVEQDTVTGSPERGFARGADAYFGPERVGPPGRNYYSFDLGGWHVVVLNVIMGGPKAPVTYNNASEQIAWLGMTWMPTTMSNARWRSGTTRCGSGRPPPRAIRRSSSRRSVACGWRCTSTAPTS